MARKNKTIDKNPRLGDIAIGTFVLWQERKVQVMGKKRHSDILVSLKLLPHDLALEEKALANEQNRPPRDVSFTTRPIAAGIRVRRLD